MLYCTVCDNTRRRRFQLIESCFCFSFFSLTPCFSWVSERSPNLNRFSGFPQRVMRHDTMITFHRCLSLELNDWHPVSVGGVNLILKPKLLTIAVRAKKRPPF